MEYNKAIKSSPQKDVGRTAFYAASYGRRSGCRKIENNLNVSIQMS